MRWPAATESQAAMLRQHLLGELAGYDYRADRLPAVAGHADANGPVRLDRSADADPVRVFCDGGADADDRSHQGRDAADFRDGWNSAASC